MDLIKYLIQIIPVWNRYRKEWRRDELRDLHPHSHGLIYSRIYPLAGPSPLVLRRATLRFYFIASLCGTHKPLYETTLRRRKDGGLATGQSIHLCPPPPSSLCSAPFGGRSALPRCFHCLFGKELRFENSLVYLCERSTAMQLREMYSKCDRIKSLTENSVVSIEVKINTILVLLYLSKNRFIVKSVISYS